MIKITKKYSVVGIAIIVAFLLAFFPTSSFIGKPFIVDSNFGQQHYNEVGLFTVSSFQAAKYFASNPGDTYWLDVRNAKEFSKKHLSLAINETIKQLKYSSWKPNDLILVYGDSTEDAQEAVALLRQVLNADAYAIKGGFNEVNKYLITPIGLEITANFSDKNLMELVELRNQISGKKVSSKELLEKLKSNKPKAIKEGC